MSTDYADFRYQQAHLLTKQSGGKGEGFASIEPLEKTGGLRPNQVAELVYLEVQVGVKAETTGTDFATVDVRGTVGSNIDLDDNVGDLNTGGEFTEDPTEPFGGGGGATLGTQDKDGVFMNYLSANGEAFYNDRAFRDLVGRGPVLDSNDDIDVTMIHVNEASQQTEAQVTLHMVWDVYEIDDARTEFSVPK